MYYNYHATATKLIKQNKLICYYFTDEHNGIRPALVLIFDDEKHPVMPVRKEKFLQYLALLPSDKKVVCPKS
ncbi:MAG: thermostable hemolysin delta-VPH [Clostridia bacterium]|nr:thermostable hemolysin delta-VPH [Clostridia bacterium]